jgi:hypothetical protein
MQAMNKARKAAEEEEELSSEEEEEELERKELSKVINPWNEPLIFEDLDGNRTDDHLLCVLSSVLLETEKEASEWKNPEP